MKRRRQKDIFEKWLEDMLKFYGLDGRRKRRKTTWPLNRNKKVKITNVSFSENMSFYYLNSLEDLESLCSEDQRLFESPSDYFIVDGFQVFRFVKPETQPRVLRVENIELNPDYYGVKAQLSQAQLFDFAKREQIFIFETEDSYVIPSTICLFAKKEKGGESR